MKNIFSPFKYLIIGSAFFAIASCGSAEVDIQDIKYTKLSEAINKYYEFEKSGAWEKAYALRTPNFRKSVTEDYYVSKMQQDNAGWTLLEFKILSVMRIKKDEIVVEMDFLQSVPENSDINKALDGKYDKLNFSENSVWVKIDDEWYCKSAGARMHLPLNHAFE